MIFYCHIFIFGFPCKFVPVKYRGSGRSASTPPPFNLQDAGEQHSSCNVNSEDLVTAARAAVTRVMKGMCCDTSKYLNTLVLLHHFDVFKRPYIS